MAKNINPFFTVDSGEFVIPGSAASTVTMKTTGRYDFGTLSDGMTSTPPALTVHGRPVDIRPFMVEPDMDMLNDKSSPYNLDVETLVNLWIVRFGKEWVGNEAVDEVEDDVDFWRHLANRLRDLGRMEMHTLASSYRIVLRIVE